MRRWLAAAAAIVVAGTVAGCEPGEPSPEPCSEPDQPEGRPGQAAPLLSLGGPSGTRGATQVLYEDGWVLTQEAADADGPAAVRPMYAGPVYDDDPRVWRSSYVGACEIEQVRELAAETFVEGIEFGSPTVTDMPSTTMTWYGDGKPVEVSAYALGHEGEYDGTSRDERAARERLHVLIELLDAGVATGDVAPTGYLRVARLGSEIEDPPDWPGPPTAELLADQECGRIDGEDAVVVHDHLLAGGQAPEGVWIAVGPIGVEPCP
ncbi:hypothetical protein [Georgenia deserti]|uniref:Secreted protein n=1 Tax=Georgenia deserti TaxID=2093781 RepID=A0ABW4L3A9_9MICO